MSVCEAILTVLWRFFFFHSSLDSVWLMVGSCRDIVPVHTAETHQDKHPPGKLLLNTNQFLTFVQLAVIVSL